MRSAFTTTTFSMLGGLLVWIADFVFVYGFAAVACARGFADVSWFGVPVVALMTLLASSVAGVVTVLVVRRGYRLHRGEATDDHARFIGFVTLASGALALIALVLLVLPVLVVNACQGP